MVIVRLRLRLAGLLICKLKGESEVVLWSPVCSLTGLFKAVTEGRLHQADLQPEHGPIQTLQQAISEEQGR